MAERVDIKKEDSQVVTKGKKGRAGLADFIEGLAEEVAWMTKKTLLGVNLKKKDNQWLLVLTVDSRKGKEVAFIEGSDLLECYRTLWWQLHYGRVAFAKSRY